MQKKAILDGCNAKKLTDKDVERLGSIVRPYYTDKRFRHALAVEEEAASIGKIYMPDDVQRLRAASLLHDITKKDDLKKQLQYCEEFGIIVKQEDLLSPKIFHAKTAAALAAVRFADYIDEDIVSGVKWHTTGHWGMTVFESIIYLADWIEPTRDFPDCITLRNYFYDKLQAAGGHDDDLSVLHDTMIYSFDLTIKNLISDMSAVDVDTIGARNYFLGEKVESNSER